MIEIDTAPYKSDDRPPISAGIESVGAMSRRPLALLAIGLTALLFVLPFLNPIAWLPIPSFNAEWTAAVLLAGSLLAVSLAMPVRFSVQWPLPTFLALLGAVAAVQYLRGMLTFSFNLWILLIYCLTALAAYLLGRAIRCSGYIEAFTRSIAVATIVGGSLSVLIQTLQIANVSGLPYWLFLELRGEVQNGYPYANLGQPNHLATYLAMAGVGVLYMDRHWRRWVAWLLLGLFGAGLAMTGSRMGLGFAALLGVTALTGRLGLAPEKRTRRRQLAVSVGIGYLLGTVAVKLLLHPGTGATLTAVERYAEGGFGMRLAMWRDAAMIAASNPLLGVGTGEYGGAQYLAAVAHPRLVPTPYAHNQVLQIAAEFGLVVAAASLALGAWWFVAAIRQRLGRREAAMALIALLPLAAHSLLEYPLAYMFFVIVGALLFGLSEPDLQRGVQVVRSRHVFLPIAVAGLVAVVPMKLDYDALAALTKRFYDERRAQVGHSLETAMGLQAVAKSTFFLPQAERLIIEFLPFSAQADDESLERTWRAMTKLSDPVLIARYIVLLARTGRSEQALPHVERLRTFSQGGYPFLRELIVRELSADDGTLNNLRAALVRE
jgi:hypothetical protein